MIYRGSVITSGNEAWNRNVLNADGRSTETGLYHDRYLLPAGRSAANRSGRMMEQTDGRTATVGSANKLVSK